MAVKGWVMLPCNYVDEVYDPVAAKTRKIACRKRFGKMKDLTHHKLVDHQIGVKRRVLTRDQIAEAQKCPNWQELRIMMKGLPTTRKMFHINAYLQRREFDHLPDYYCCHYDMRYIQVLNYLNDMVRTALIEHLDDLTTMNLEKYWDRIKVKK